MDEAAKGACLGFSKNILKALSLLLRHRVIRSPYEGCGSLRGRGLCMRVTHCQSGVIQQHSSGQKRRDATIKLNYSLNSSVH